MPNTPIFMSPEEDLIHPLNNHISIFIFYERKYKKRLGDVKSRYFILPGIIIFSQYQTY